MSDSSVSGLGIDIVETSRMEAVLKRTPSFKTKVFTDSERQYCDSKARPAVHYAMRFAAKEAVLKALGCGFSGVRACDVEIADEASGRPVAVLAGKVKEKADALGVLEIPVSLSRTSLVCVANAVAITSDKRPSTDEKTDPREEIEAAFKEAKAIVREMDMQFSSDAPGGAAGDAAVVDEDPEG